MRPEAPTSFGHAEIRHSYSPDQSFAVWRPTNPARIVSTMMNDTALAIASRHIADTDEAGRTCRACGRPWPCDVRQIVAALTVSPRATTHRATLTTTHRATPVGTTRTRRRSPATSTVHS